MITIVEGQKNIKKIIGKQICKDTVYRRMKYLLCSHCKDGLLLHNVISGQMVLLNQEEEEIFVSLPCRLTDFHSALVESYFLVPEDFVEEDFLETLRILMRKLFQQKGINAYTILPTTNCNARCFYCYESEYVRINMNEEIAHKAVEFMIANKGDKPLHLSWFGGEPLVGIPRIDQICNELNEREIPFSSSMISNGYLFNDGIVDRANNCWHLRNLQITLDGTEDVYNKTKAYVSAVGSPYQQVLRNIRLLLTHGIRVSIRMNLDQHNVEDLNELIDILLDEFKQYHNFDMYVHVVYENEGFAPIKRDSEHRILLAKEKVELNKKIMQGGYGKYNCNLPSLRIHSCMADSPNSAVIYPDGKLFKCEHVRPGDEYGYLDNSIRFENNISKFKVPAALELCERCPLRPSCYLLQECNGVQERDETVCSAEVDARTNAMQKVYQQYLDKQSTSLQSASGQGDEAFEC